MNRLCRKNPKGVLNGIAYDINKDLCYITGKNWNYTYICSIKLDINK
jgi:glutamine cyclotransferase